MTEFQTRRRQHARDALALVPALSAALEWPAEVIAAKRDERLRALVRHALEHAPWHRQRLAGIDLRAAGADLVAQIPVMTKTDLMTNFDEIVTDPRLTLASVERHLDGLPETGYLLDRYTAIASGGSSGYRGCFVYGWDEFATLWVGLFRYLLREPRPGGRGPVVASVTAGHPSHPTAALDRLFAGPHLDMRRLPVTMAIPDVVEGLNTCAPEILFGYPSALHQLAHEADCGRLRIQPRRIIVVAEPLLPETRAVIEQTWGVSVSNLYGTSEAGPTGIPCDLAQMHMSEDLVILEPVDAAGRPVPDGITSATVYLTNLYNRTLPMLRLEVTDEVTVLPGRCPCGSAHRMIADIAGRRDDYFHYGSVSVHPHIFRHALGSRASIVEYQVRQEAQGASIDLRCVAPLDVASLTEELVRDLRSLGLPDPLVTIRLVDHLDRSVGGKLKRFVPLVPERCRS